jgi:uncharacterized protein (DUF2235 family)
MSKNIVVFSDGTGLEGGKGADSNIYKTFKMIENRTSRQISFYDKGLGTEWWRKVSGNVGGAGISKNIQECYRFIFENYEAGDQIYLFGFSRGAATVRSLSSFIHLFGILPKSRPELISKAYRIYRIKDEKKRESEAEKFVKAYHNMWVKIKFLGCYDTVAALGTPLKMLSNTVDYIPFFKHSFHDFKLSASVESAYHALAIDDERKSFHPILWDADISEEQHLKQVWFCGMHTDVGGGYEKAELSDLPLTWILKMAMEKNLLMYSEHEITIGGDANGHMHNSRNEGWWTKLYRKEVRSWDTERTDKPIVHRSVLERKHNQDNGKTPVYAPWILELDYEIEEY